MQKNPRITAFLGVLSHSVPSHGAAPRANPPFLCFLSSISRKSLFLLACLLLETLGFKSNLAFHPSVGSSSCFLAPPCLVLRHQFTFASHPQLQVRCPLPRSKSSMHVSVLESSSIKGEIRHPWYSWCPWFLSQLWILLSFLTLRNPSSSVEEEGGLYLFTW